jgi:pimeloyl-ACP methyl ester carboxylesterase
LLAELRTTALNYSLSDVSEPITTRDGLAVYIMGIGLPLLLFPSPHGMTLHSTAESPLTQILARIGRRVITFDPPGAYRSTGPARVDMNEMLECAQFALEICRVNRPIDVVGHGMGSLCALSMAIEHPRLVNRMVLINAASGPTSIQRNHGIPWYWPVTSRKFWKWVSLSLKVRGGHGSLASHKQLVRLTRHASFYNQSLIPDIPIHQDDFRRPAPLRNRWDRTARQVDFSDRLGRVWSQTLVCASRHDPQTPPGCSRELALGIPYARQVIFEQSGHYPYIEEPVRFQQELIDFFSEISPIL